MSFPGLARQPKVKSTLSQMPVGLLLSHLGLLAPLGLAALFENENFANENGQISTEQDLFLFFPFPFFPLF